MGAILDSVHFTGSCPRSNKSTSVYFISCSFYYITDDEDATAQLPTSPLVICYNLDGRAYSSWSLASYRWGATSLKFEARQSSEVLGEIPVELLVADVGPGDLALDSDDAAKTKQMPQEPNFVDDIEKMKLLYGYKLLI